MAFFRSSTLLILYLIWTTEFDTTVARKSKPCLPDVSTCLKQGKNVFREFIITARHHKPVDLCRILQSPEDALDTVSESFKADNYLSVISDLKLYKGYYDTYCKNNLDAVLEEKKLCMSSEIAGGLSRRQEDFLKFNLIQNTGHDCFFLRLYLYSQQDLVGTGCDSDLGNVTYSLFKMAKHELISKHRCDTKQQRKDKYQTFQYSETCGRQFRRELLNCSKIHIVDNTPLTFSNDFELISTSRKKFKRKCRSYDMFMKCSRQIRSSCTEGVEQLLDYRTTLRKYLIRMEFMCSSDIIDEYAAGIPCYTELVRHKAFQKCSSSWRHLTPWLQNTSAYQYYCESHNRNAVNLKLQLTRVRECLTELFYTKCNRSSVEVMQKFWDIVFSQPVYLRMNFKPNCVHHKPRDTHESMTSGLVHSTSSISQRGIGQRRQLSTSSSLSYSISLAFYLLLSSVLTYRLCT